MTEIAPAAMKFLRQRLSLRHLRLILVLDEERSITRTADRLCISQAAVSKTRAEIEKGIGAPLFEWFGHRLEVTAVGKCVLQSARRIVAELECLGDEFQLMQSGMGGVLAIGTRTISGQPFLARVTAAFKKANPAVTVQLVDTDLASLLERLSKGTISLLFGRFEATCASAGIEAQTVLSDRNVLLASPGHPLADQRKVSWPDLVKQSWVLTPEGYVGRYAREQLAAELSRHQLPFPSDLVETQSLLLTMTLFQSGDFLTILPEGVAAHLESRGLARVLSIPPIGPIDPVCLMWRSDVALPPAARRFREFAIGLLEDDQRLEEKGEPLPLRAEAQRFETVLGVRSRSQPNGVAKLPLPQPKAVARARA
jgi:LysR family transcriptional regulator, pca operon transcriptional activator